MARWTISDIPSLKGRSAVVTGTGGIGFETALELARAGGEVIVAGRNPRKGREAVGRIRAETSSPIVRFEEVDLSSLDSVADLAARLRTQRLSLDLLVNNAAVMAMPARQETPDGFEMQLGVNYLGHFALTAQLMPLLREGDHPRVVTVSSIAARQGKINFEDPQALRSYAPMAVYAQSKVACLMFAFELQRRSHAENWGVESLAAHPGITRTDLIHNGRGPRSIQGIIRSTFQFLFQPAPQGALPSLFAATSPQAKPGAYYGPDRLSETRGYPTLARTPDYAKDRAACEHLWNLSEQLTGVSFQAECSRRLGSDKQTQAQPWQQAISARELGLHPDAHDFLERT